ncbi:general transcription factor II-I repeat domain-containing protein 2-like isoform X4 [Balaenoptera ricei]|uniref:general transcription factor II-I repeat domain-containing protein 2-like isoform X4 n=1 Tax=Balaenoptera ricei TaxID=2746895 RepID=UPI0028BE7D76|nr:general transcription factor II-I repeat domain-containing protein 2-like isoform X4 [Balaenoptera ricei]
MGKMRRQKIRTMAVEVDVPQKNGAKLPKDRRSAMLENHEKRHENPEEDEDGNAKTLLIKNLPDRVTQHELIEVFEDTFQIRLVSKDGMSERIASIDFKSQADAERALEEKQGTEIGGLAVVLNLVRAKIQGQDERDRKKCNWRMGKRKLEQENHALEEKWERAYFFVEVKERSCMFNMQSLSVSRECDLRHRYESNHRRNHDGFTEKMCDRKFNELKKRLKFQHDLLLNVNKISDAAMKCSYILSEKIAQAAKPFAGGEFIKGCLLSAAEIMCPEQRQAFANIRLTGSVVAQHVDNMTENLQDKLQEKAESFVAFSIAAQEGVDGNNDPHVGVFIRGGNETFDVTEDLLDMVPITGTTSGNELVLHVEKSLKTFNVDWSKLVSISTDGDSAMVGVN